MSNKKQILINVDKNYIFPLLVAIDSIEQNVKIDEYEIILMSIGLEDRIKNVILNIFNIDIKIIEADHIVPDNLPKNMFYTKTVYAKLFLEKIFNFNDRFIYLDPDIIVKDNLDYLFNFNLNNKPIAAVQSQITPYISNFFGLPYWHELNADPLTNYFNSGVMVIDFKKWKEFNFPIKTFEHVDKHGKEFLLADQEVLNSYILGDFAKLPIRWNQETPMRIKKLGHFAYACNSFEDVKDAENNPAIIHFTGAYGGRSKPWLELGIEPLEDEWNSRKNIIKQRIINLNIQ